MLRRCLGMILCAFTLLVGVNQAFYAHLDSISTIAKNAVSKDVDTIKVTDSIGVTGKTSTISGLGVHLHLEIRESASTDTIKEYRYPLNHFFANYADKLKMAYLNRTAASPTSVTFRIALTELGNLTTLDSNDTLKFHYNKTMVLGHLKIYL